MIALVLALAPLAQDESVGARWRVWKAEIDGHIQGQGDALPSSDIDVARELGLDDEENGNELQVYVNVPFFGRLYAGYWWIDFDGSQVLSRTITFADRSFTSGTRVDTELELDMYYLTYEFPLPIPLGTDDFNLSVGFQIGARALLVDASIQSSLFSAQDSGGTGIPVLGVHGILQLTSYVRVELELAGLAASYADTSLRYFDGFAEVVGQIGPVFAGVGYKWASVDLEDERGDVDLEVDVELDGFYLTAGARF
jgi:hypothetical protein